MTQPEYHVGASGSRTVDEIVYCTPDDGVDFYLRTSDGTAWLTQGEISRILGTSPQNVSQIIRRIHKDGAITPGSVKLTMLTRFEGSRRVNRALKQYNLDVVLAVARRATTPRAAGFYDWAETYLKRP